MLVAALETEVAAYLETHREERDDDGHALVVRNGKGRTQSVRESGVHLPTMLPAARSRIGTREPTASYHCSADFGPCSIASLHGEEGACYGCAAGSALDRCGKRTDHA
jgi:hypothetical protein